MNSVTEAVKDAALVYANSAIDAYHRAITQKPRLFNNDLQAAKETETTRTADAGIVHVFDFSCAYQVDLSSSMETFPFYSAEGFSRIPLTKIPEGANEVSLDATKASNPLKETESFFNVHSNIPSYENLPIRDPSVKPAERFVEAITVELDPPPYYVSSNKLRLMTQQELKNSVIKGMLSRKQLREELARRSGIPYEQ